MTEEEIAEIKRIQNEIVAVVAAESPKPLSPTKLYEHFRRKNDSEDLVRAAMWFLLDGNRLDFTINRSLILPPAAPTTSG